MSRVTLVCWLSVLSGPVWAAEYVVDGAKGSDHAPGTADRPFATIAKGVSVAEPGDVVSVLPGAYQESVVIDRSGEPGRPVTLRGASDRGEVLLTGTDWITGWERLAGDPRPIWVKRPWTQVWCGWNDNMSHGADPPVGRCEQVVVDGKLLRQVLRPDDLQPGTFLADPKDSKALYVWLTGDADPALTPVNVATRDVLLSVRADNVAVTGLTLRWAANMAQHGALDLQGSHVTVSDCAIEWTNGSGVSFRGDNIVIQRVTSRHNGQLGMGGGGVECAVRDCSLLGNNEKGFPSGWEAGGIKITHALRTNVYDTTAAWNNGSGIWYDIDNRECEVSGCWLQGNQDSGIFIEISGTGGMDIHDNLSSGNGLGGNWAASGICLAESTDCDVHNNVCIGNPCGIGIREQGPRTFEGREGADVTYATARHNIHENTCVDNARAQFGLWWDNVFFGPHPSPEVGSRGTPLDPVKAELRMSDNVYATTMRPSEALIAWGVPWREKHREFATVGEFTAATGLDQGSLVLSGADAERILPALAGSPVEGLRAGLTRKLDAPEP